VSISELMGGRLDLIGVLEVQERTPEQILFDSVMARLDEVHGLALGVETVGGTDLYSKRVKLESLAGLSGITRDLLGNPSTLRLYVEFRADSRTLGLRSGGREVVFKLDKTGEECLPQIGRQVGSLLHKIWEREDAQDVPATDALVLVEKGLESY